MPESETIEKESAEIWRRIAALVYDAFILLALSMAFGAIVVIFSAMLGNKPDDTYTPTANGNAVFPLWYGVLAYFYIYFWRRGGQTIGMKAWRLQLTGQQGESPSLRQCIIRAFVAPIVIELLLIGYFWKLIDKDQLCLQDRLSKTRVRVLRKVSS